MDLMIVMLPIVGVFREIEFLLEAALFRDHFLHHALRRDTSHGLRTKIAPSVVLDLRRHVGRWQLSESPSTVAGGSIASFPDGKPVARCL